MKVRQALRARTARYKGYQAKYRMSAKAKILDAEWNERNKERLREQRHLAYLKRRAARGPKVYRCETLLCRGTFIRVRGSRMKFCAACAVAFYGMAYMLRRSRPPMRKAA